MFATRIAKVSLLVSLAGHLGVLGFHWPGVQKEAEYALPLQIEIRVPPDLPRIEEPAEEKELKQKQEEVKPQPQLQQKEGQRDTGSVKNNVPGEKEKLRYQDMVKQRIQEARRYPAWAKKYRVEGTVQISFNILANGTVKRVQIIAFSGNRMLDKEALATIYRAAPFPPFPKSWNLAEFPVQVTIVFLFTES